jgi:hypothetical protein
VDWGTAGIRQLAPDAVQHFQVWQVWQVRGSDFSPMVTLVAT